MNILIIEDEPYSREAMTLLLSDLGHNVKALSSLESLGEHKESFVSDITFTDIELDKTELSDSHISKLSQEGRSKIVIVTGRSYEELSQCAKNNLFHFIRKPVDFNEIEEIILKIEQEGHPLSPIVGF